MYVSFTFQTFLFLPLNHFFPKTYDRYKDRRSTLIDKNWREWKKFDQVNILPHESFSDNTKEQICQKFTKNNE
jgi:hypothetical protein